SPRGRVAVRRKPPSDVGVASTVPPRAVTRSLMPARPRPAPGAVASVRSGAVLVTRTVRSVVSWTTVTVTAEPGAWRRALLRASWTVRKAVRPTASETSGAVAEPVVGEVTPE